MASKKSAHVAPSVHADHEAHSTKCLAAANPETTVILARVPSDSVPGFMYEIRQSKKTGHCYCSCPSWKYSKLPATARTCKHLKRLAAGLGAGDK